MNTTSKNFSAYDHRTGVQKAYTEQGILRVLRAKHAQKSLRKIADEYGPPITHADIERAFTGVFPRSPQKRAALGLPPMLPAPACSKCGRVHTTARCTEGRQPRRRWVREAGHAGGGWR